MDGNPFVPQPGQTPPLLAGRDDELKHLTDTAGALAEGRRGHMGALMAPRGYGKTVLLAEFANRLERPGPPHGTARPLRVLSINAVDMNTPDDLLAVLHAPEHGRHTRKTSGGVSVAGFGARFGRDVHINIPTAVRHWLREMPTVLIVDEGAALRPDATQVLLNAAQSVNTNNRAQVMLTIAGTPGVEDALNRASATFWDKADKTRLSLLTDEAAREAIEKPLRDRGMRIEPDAIGVVVRESHGYPLFVQAWGKALFDHARRKGGAPLTTVDVDAARSAFLAKRNEIYAQRIGEMGGRLRDAALQVAKAFQAKGPAGVLSLKEVDIAIAKSLPDHMEDDAERIDKIHLDLKRLGFFWCDDVTEGLDYGRGIPSLMDYAVEVLGRNAHARAPAVPTAS